MTSNFGGDKDAAAYKWTHSAMFTVGSSHTVVVVRMKWMRDESIDLTSAEIEGPNNNNTGLDNKAGCKGQRERERTQVQKRTNVKLQLLKLMNKMRKPLTTGETGR